MESKEKSRKSYYEKRNRKNSHARRTGTFDGCRPEQSRRSFDAAFRVRDFGDFECAVCVPEGDAAAYAWNVDVYFPGTARLYADDYAEKIRPHLPVQFCGRLCVWRTDGSSRALDYTSSGKSAAVCAVFCAELSDPLFRYCAFKPL